MVTFWHPKSYKEKIISDKKIKQEVRKRFFGIQKVTIKIEKIPLGENKKRGKQVPPFPQLKSHKIFLNSQQQNRCKNPGKNIIEHNAPGIMQLGIRPFNRPHFDNVKNPKQNKTDNI